MNRKMKFALMLLGIVLALVGYEIPVWYSLDTVEVLTIAGETNFTVGPNDVIIAPTADMTFVSHGVFLITINETSIGSQPFQDHYVTEWKSTDMETISIYGTEDVGVFIDSATSTIVEIRHMFAGYSRATKGIAIIFGIVLIAFGFPYWIFQRGEKAKRH